MRFLNSLALAIVLATSTALAQVPTFSVVDTGLNTIFGNAGKGIFDPQVVGLTGIAFGSGTFVVVANSTGEDVIRWATSPDGTTWTPHSQVIGGGQKSFSNSRVHFLNGQFLFFAEHIAASVASGWVYTSSDGFTWMGRKIVDSRLLFEDFDAGPNLTVVAGRNGTQYVSGDLVIWTPDPAIPPGSDHNDVAYIAGRFVSTVNGFGGQTFYSSPDALTWTPIPDLAAPGGGRVETGDGFVLLNLGSNRWRSPDGITFTQFTPTTNPSSWVAPGGSPRFTGGRFVASGFDLGALKSGYLAASDGQNWTPIAYYNEAPMAPPGQSRLYFHIDIAYGNGKYVMAGQDISQTISTKTVLPLIMVVAADAGPMPTSTATATIGVTTPTPMQDCTGDCDGLGAVTVDELVIGINIALGNAQLDACGAFDSSGDGNITVDELVTAVTNALNGCIRS